MKNILIICILLVGNIFAQDSINDQVQFSGFAQVLVDSSGFSFKKARTIISGPIEVGFLGVKSSYTFYTDFNTDGKPEIGFAQIDFKLPIGPTVIVGRTLNPIVCQFPGTAQLPLINFPAAFLVSPYSTGIFAKDSWQDLWAIAGISNGTAGFKDDNKSLDIGSRVTYSFSSLTGGIIYSSGKQLDGYRQIVGADITWKNNKLWLNAGQNIASYKGKKIASWLIASFDLSKYFQLAGMIESLQKDGHTTTGYGIGLNILPTSKTVVRLDQYKLASSDKTGWAIMFQTKF